MDGRSPETPGQVACSGPSWVQWMSVRLAGGSGLGQAEAHDQCPVQLDNMIVTEPPEVIAEVGSWHRCNFVDHQEAALVEAIWFGWLDGYSK